MNYSFFLDESGDHSLSFIDSNFPLFLLCGCLVREDALREITTKTNEFKEAYFGTTEVILHSREIRKCEGAFQILFDLNLKARFYEDLNQILSRGEYCILGSGIHKGEHIKKYGKVAVNPYSLSFSFLLERLIFHLDQVDEDANVQILAEKRGKKEDRMLIADFNSIMDQGTAYVESERLKHRITEFSFHGKGKNVIGLQIADLCAYPLARHLLNPREPYVSFQVIESKIYCDQEGRYEGWGLKLFP